MANYASNLKFLTMAMFVLVLIIGHIETVTASSSECKNAEADIVFLLDSSTSVTSANFHLQKEFVANVSQTFEIGPRNVQIAIVTFAATSKNEFSLSSYRSKPQLLDAIRNIQYTPGSTGTGLGLYYVRSNSFSASQGDRKNVPNILIVMTDGKSDNPMHTKMESAAVHNLHIAVIAVGIGGDGIDRKELATIASDPGNVFITQGFSSLYSVYDRLLNATCSARTTLEKDMLKHTTKHIPVFTTKMVDRSSTVGLQRHTTVKHATRPSSIKTFGSKHTTKMSTRSPRKSSTFSSKTASTVSSTSKLIQTISTPSSPQTTSTQPSTTTYTKSTASPPSGKTFNILPISPTTSSSQSPQKSSTQTTEQPTVFTSIIHDRTSTAGQQTIVKYGGITTNLNRIVILHTRNGTGRFSIISPTQSSNHSMSNFSSTRNESEVFGASAEKQSVVVHESTDSKAHVIVCAVLGSILAVLIIGQIVFKYIEKILPKKKSEVAAKPLDF